MLCPYCGKEIKDDALFCGFCGGQIPQAPQKEALAAPLSDTATPEAANRLEDVPIGKVKRSRKKKRKDSPSKKHTALKLLLVFVLISFLSGSVLGFLAARDIVSLRSLIPGNDFKWTSFSEGHSESIVPEDPGDKENEEEDARSRSPTDGGLETGPPPDPADPSLGPAAPEEGGEAAQSDAYHAQYIGDLLVVIDDKAHIWAEETIAGIMENATAMSEISGYSIMIVVTDDILDMTAQEYAAAYYSQAWDPNREQAEPVSDGYIFLIDLADDEYCLSASGSAADVYTDAVKDELFDEIRQFMIDGAYETAVDQLIKKTVY